MIPWIKLTGRTSREENGLRCSPPGHDRVYRFVKNMNFVSKTRNYALKSRNCALKTRNCVFKMMNCAVTQGNWYGKEDGRHKPELVNSFLLDKTTAWQGVQAILTALYVSDAACFVYTCRRLIDLSDCRYSREAGDTRGQKLELAMLDSGLNLFWPDSAAFGGAATAARRTSHRQAASTTPTTFSRQRMASTRCS